MNKSMMYSMCIKFKVFVLIGLVQITLLQNLDESLLNSTNIPTIKQTIILTYPYKISTANKIDNFSFINSNNNNKNDYDSVKNIESNEKLFERSKLNYLNQNGDHTQEVNDSRNETFNFDLNKTDAFLSTKIQITTELNQISNDLISSTPNTENLIKKNFQDDKINDTTEINTYHFVSTISNEASTTNSSSTDINNNDFDLINTKHLFNNNSFLLNLISNDGAKNESLNDSKLILEKLLNNLKRISQDLNKFNKPKDGLYSKSSLIPIINNIITSTTTHLQNTTIRTLNETILASTQIYTTINLTLENTQTYDIQYKTNNMTTSLAPQASTNIPIIILQSNLNTLLSNSTVIATRLKETTTMSWATSISYPIQKSSTTTNTLFNKLTSSSNMVDTILNEKISINGKNYTVVNITEIDPFNPLLSLDNHSKDLLLLSTTISTMLLCTCFFLFFFWFCCYYIFNDKKFKLNNKRVVKSVQETENNLSKLGLVEKNLQINKNEDSNLYVRDDNEYLVLKTLPKKKSSFLANNESKMSREQIELHKASDKNKKCLSGIRSSVVHEYTPTNQFETPDKPSSFNELKPVHNTSLRNKDNFESKPYDDAMSYHTYDILDTQKSRSIRSNISNKKAFKEKLKNELESKLATSNKRNYNENINEAYVSDYEYFNQNEDLNLESPTLENSLRSEKKPIYHHNQQHTSNLTNLEKASKSTGFLDAKPKVKRYSKPFENRCSTLNSPDRYKKIQVSSLNRIHSRAKDYDGKVVKNFSLRNTPRLTRNQIEKEFYEYTLECRRRLDELFASSPSSDAHQSSTDTTEFIDISSPSKNIINYSNNFKLISKTKSPELKPVNEHLFTTSRSSLNKLKHYTKPNVASFRTKKTETEQIWHI